MVSPWFSTAVRDKVSDVFADCAVAEDGPIEYHEAAVSLADQILGPEVEVTKRSRARIGQRVEILPSRMEH